MAEKYIERYNSFCKSLDSLKKVKDRDISDEFVLSGAVNKFSLTFDISWKVMKDIVIKYHQMLDIATGSPRENLRAAASVQLISDDAWMDMLHDRNDLTHDYDGELAKEKVQVIIDRYIPLFEEFQKKALFYIEEMQKE